MRHINLETAALLAALCLGGGAVHGESYHSTTELFNNEAQSGYYFFNAYAIYPNAGEAAFLVAAAHGNGRVFSHGNWMCTKPVTQLSVRGWRTLQ